MGVIGPPPPGPPGRPGAPLDPDASRAGQAARLVDVDQLIDGQAIGPQMLVLLLLATLALVSDGFDLSAIGYVGPELVRHWHVTREALVPMFTAGIVGLLIGAPTLGMLGDRIGRKRAMLISLSTLGIATLASAIVSSLGPFTVLRFLTGIGLGGVIPNAIAFLSEMVPARLRGRFLVLNSLGVAIGVALPGVITFSLVPRFGWQILMLIGGALPLGVAALLAIATPESVRYLARRGDRADALLGVARRMRPELALDAGSMIVAASPDDAPAPRASARSLFAGPLAVVTPLIWFQNAANQLASFFILTWLPTLLQSTGATTAGAGLSGSMFSIGGLASGVLLFTIIDRAGMIPMIAFCFAGAPLLAGIGVPGVPHVAHGLILAGAGLCVAGNNVAMNVLLGTLYPTSIRSAGAGWTQATGRLGAMAAPLVGGLLLSLHLPVAELLLAPAAALLLGGVACIVLASICRRAFGGIRLGEFRVD